ncbi:MAG: MFS transporter [Ferrimicrobium sp.]
MTEASRAGSSWYLLGARVAREVAFGLIAIILPLYWHDQGVSALSVGAAFTIALLGAAAISMGIGRSVDRIGRRRLLLASSLAWVVATPFLLVTHNVIAVGVIMMVGSISPTGKEIGLFLGIEQAILSRLVGGHQRTKTYAWFNLVGYVSTALGALLATAIGFATPLASHGHLPFGIFRWIIVGYSFAGLIQLALYTRVPREAEAPVTQASQGSSPTRYTPSDHVRRLVATFTALFALDAFTGGLIVQGLLVYWFRIRFGFDLSQLGLLFFGTNLLSAGSSLVAAWISSKVGLLNTMVFTHLPSNVLLILVPFMPTGELAVAVLLLRHMLSQMDVPTRQAYTMAMVDVQDRGYVASWTNGARSLGTGASPILAGAFISSSLLVIPFVLAGGLKIVYDIALFGIFRRVPTPYSDTR